MNKYAPLNAAIGLVLSWTVLCVLCVSPAVNAFTFFTAYDASITRLVGDTYQFRISVDYSLDMKDNGDGVPAMGAFFGFSLGPLWGTDQRNFAPYSDRPGEHVWYSDDWWHADHLGFVPLSLPGNTFGYDFDYVGNRPHFSTQHYAAQAVWTWFDWRTGQIQYDSEIFEGDVAISTRRIADPIAVPEVPSLFLLALGMAGLLYGRTLTRKTINPFDIEHQ